MAIITNHQKLQLLDFSKKYPCIIYVKNILNVCFKGLRSNKTKSIAALKLKFSECCKYVTTKSCFKQSCKNNVFLDRYNKNCFRSKIVIPR